MDPPNQCTSMTGNKGAGMAKWILITVIAVVAGAAAWLLTPSPENDSGSGDAPAARSLVGGPFSLLNQDGERVTEADFRGSYFLVYFGYTYCPDVCPVDLQSMSAALDIIEADTLARIEPAFITIDPERDTVEVVNKYVSLFHPKLTGMTGTVEEIDAVASAYRVYARKVETESDSDYLVDHSAIVYLMDPDGNYVTHFSSGFSPEGMARRLEEIVG